MNVLEQLREDVTHSIPQFVDVTGPLRVLDRFISKYEAVEVDADPQSGSPRPDRCWYERTDTAVGSPQTILVPRTQEPTLLEAAARADKLLERVEAAKKCYRGFVLITDDELCEARTALSEAIQREQD